MPIPKFSNLSIRTQLIVLAVLLTLPALGIIIYSGLKERSIDYQHAVVESQKLAENLAAKQEILTNEAKLLCTLLAGLPEVKSHDVDKLQAILADIHKQSSQYINILVADAEGHVWASALPSAKDESIKDRRYFKSAQQTKKFSSGEFVISRSVLKPTLHMAYPLLDHGEFDGAIILGFDLDVMRTILERAQLSFDTNYVLVDHNGIIVNRGKEPGLLIGKPIPADTLKYMEGGPDQDTFKFMRRDASHRITTYRKLWLPGEQKPYMYVRAGIAEKDVLSASNRALVINLSTLLFFVVLSFLLAFFIGKRSIVDRITVLKRASQRLAGGDLDIRVSSQISGSELGSLAETFDSMAQELGAREKSLQVANHELEAFSYSLSHDLRSYLTRISLAGETLQALDGEHLSHEGKYCQQTILDTCQGMNGLITTMLTLAHISRQELRLEEVDLSRLAEIICAELALTEPERTLNFDISPGLQVTGDAALLRVALENLLGNACKYTKGKAEVHISLSAKQQEGRQVFALADNGIGFDMEEAGALFRPFKRLSSSQAFSGLGIGLTTVERIIKRHGGEIWAEAVPNEGATFFFTIS
ncbi:sensor histidine kinase [Geopsychrobacter electrodiphilus]|uniref:sensor histidine kinase n=1 Tax=Geopsychrobacter electrodiphilus TaxID=225196 RepID=UPI000361EA41|nr:ATP-binding protein [Geopsychrobacter electrodiphilus]